MGFDGRGTASEKFYWRPVAPIDIRSRCSNTTYDFGRYGGQSRFLGNERSVACQEVIIGLAQRVSGAPVRIGICFQSLCVFLPSPFRVMRPIRRPAIASRDVVVWLGEQAKRSSDTLDDMLWKIAKPIEWL